MRAAALLRLVLGTHCAPEQVHLAFAGAAGGRPTGVRVAWFTQDACDSVVEFGPGLKQQAQGTKAQYLKGEGWHHVAEIVGLPPSAAVSYRVGGASGWSAPFSFVAAPSANSTASFKLAVYGDLGFEDSTKRPMLLHGIDGLEKKWDATHSRERLEALHNAQALDWVWHVGDIGYVDDSFAHNPFTFHYEETYNGFMNWMQNLTSRMPYMVSPGNHESECHSPACLVSPFAHRGKALANFSAYNARWHMPAEESKARAGQSMWYSFDYGPVHFVSVNTETDWPGAEERETGDGHFKSLKAGGFGLSGEYLAWVEADLKAASAARASKAPGSPSFIVAGGHRPFGDLKSEHTSLFTKYGVDLYLSGHAHSYSRSYPVNGTTYIVAGGAGCDEMPLPNNTTEKRPGPALYSGLTAPANSVAFASPALSVGTLECSADRLHFELLDSKSGRVLDQVTITKKGQDAWRQQQELVLV